MPIGTCSRHVLHDAKSGGLVSHARRSDQWRLSCCPCRGVAKTSTRGCQENEPVTTGGVTHLTVAVRPVTILSSRSWSRCTRYTDTHGTRFQDRGSFTLGHGARKRSTQSPTNCSICAPNRGWGGPGPVLVGPPTSGVTHFDFCMVNPAHCGQRTLPFLPPMPAHKVPKCALEMLAAARC